MLSHFISNICYVIFGINFMLFAFFTKTKRVKSLLWFKYYMWAILIVQLVTHTLTTLSIKNLFLSHFYFIFQFVTVSYFYKNLFKSNLLKKIISYILLLVLIILATNYALAPHQFFEFNTIEVFACSLPLVVYSSIYLFRSIETMNKKWIYFSGGLIVYLLSSSLVFSGADIILQKYISDKGFLNFWTLNNIIYIIYQLLLSFEWYENFRKKNNLT